MNGKSPTNRPTIDAADSIALVSNGLGALKREGGAFAPGKLDSRPRNPPGRTCSGRSRRAARLRGAAAGRSGAGPRSKVGTQRCDWRQIQALRFKFKFSRIRGIAGLAGARYSNPASRPPQRAGSACKAGYGALAHPTSASRAKCCVSSAPRRVRQRNAHVRSVCHLRFPTSHGRGTEP